MALSMEEVSTSVAKLVEERSSAVVRVEGRRRLAASGIVWSAAGIIVTANHVVERNQVSVGLPDGNELNATVVGRDAGIDLAVLRADTDGLLPANWITGSTLPVGSLVLALGRPRQHTQATLGIISAVEGEWRTRMGGTIDAYVQTDVLMYPGFSGGPLMSAAGQFIGLNSSGLARGVSVTVPIQTLAPAVESILAHGHVQRGYLGVGVQPVRLSDSLRELVAQERGLMVMSVEAGSPAEQAGIAQGDLLIRLGDSALTDVEELQLLLRSVAVGQQVEVRLLRGGSIHNLGVTIGQSTG